MQKKKQKTPGELFGMLLKEKNMIQTTLAANSKVSQPEISQLKNGQRNFSFGTISKLAQGLGITVETFKKKLHIRVALKKTEKENVTELRYNNDEAMMVYSYFLLLNATIDDSMREQLIDELYEKLTMYKNLRKQKRMYLVAR